jgi:signal transduction histidine kinase
MVPSSERASASPGGGPPAPALERPPLAETASPADERLADALAQQRATSEILSVIVASRADVQPVFETIARSALRFCRAEFANVFTYDGSLIHLAAIENANADYVAKVRALFPRPPGRGTAVERAIATGRICIIPDVLEDPDYVIAAAAAISGYRSVLAVPLMRDGQPIGTIAVGRPVPGPFPESQIALVQTFADQAVIAIVNARLLNQLEQRNRDLVESLEQQTATSDILRVISSSRSDVQPVFDTIARAAMSLCAARSANVVTFDGTLVHVAAVADADPGSAAALSDHFRTYPRPPSRDTANCRAVLTNSVVAIPDVEQDPDYAARRTAVAAGYRSVLAVPLTGGRGAMGAITVARPEPGPFPDKQIALLQTFADQAVIAIENVRLFNELRARTAELTKSVAELRALGEIGRAVSSTLDLETVLSTIVSRATELTGMDGGTIYEYDEARGAFHLHTADRLPEDLVAALRAHPIRKGEGVLGRMAVAGEPVQIPDIVAEGAYQSRVRDVLVREGYRALLAVPLVRDEHLLGGLAVNRKTPGPFDAEVIALLTTFAAQSALAIQNARLFRELEVKGRALERASRHKSEFLANMSHELRTPLNAIIGFSEVLAERMFGDINDRQAEYLGDILESARHLLALINDILDLSKIEAGRIELDLAEFDVARAVDNALLLVRERAQRRDVVLCARIAPDLGRIVADERKFKQVLLNLLSNAIKFTPPKGEVTVRALGGADAVEISVSDTGVGISPADQALVFEEFRQVGAADRKAEGTGLGLAISRRFVELHGGSIRVASEPGRGATFTFRLPRQSRAA